MTTHTWKCQRQVDGVKCAFVNSARNRVCQKCANRRPPKKHKAHMAALSAVTYEEYIVLNGGEHCGICGHVRGDGERRLARDHDHVTGQPRGLLCFRCNRLLGNKRYGWMLKAVYYLKRTLHDAA